MKDSVGIAVMVHHDLTQDPLNKQGQLGIITHIVDADRVAYVRFNNNVIGLYSTDALLMLIPPELVVDKLRSDVVEMDMDVTDVLDILEMYQQHAEGTPAAQQGALDWAMTHAQISKAIVFSVEDWLEYQHNRLDTHQKSGRGR